MRFFGDLMTKIVTSEAAASRRASRSAARAFFFSSSVTSELAVCSMARPEVVVRFAAQNSLLRTYTQSGKI